MEDIKNKDLTEEEKLFVDFYATLHKIKCNILVDDDYIRDLIFKLSSDEENYEKCNILMTYIETGFYNSYEVGKLLNDNEIIKLDRLSLRLSNKNF